MREGIPKIDLDLAELCESRAWLVREVKKGLPSFTRQRLLDVLEDDAAAAWDEQGEIIRVLKRNRGTLFLADGRARLRKAP